MADLEQLVADCLDALEGGNWSKIDAICAAHPDHADTIRKRVQRIAGMGLVKSTDEPEHIGPYRILDKLGHGGMGTVYLAEQRQPVRRKVALKVIKLGMDTREVIRRFEAERQALALMNHAHIARVFDAGRTDEGRPYFAMEYVPGQPITQYCNANTLTIRQRIEILLLVCEAIQHAHSKGIIHRDLKPSNVIVGTGDDGRPMPKVIDFGVAKATHGALTDGTVYTSHGQLVGTPEYMSPEQAAWQPHDLDARADVYALGTLLYELLSGALPFDAERLRNTNPAEMFRILQEEPAPPLLSYLVDDATCAERARQRASDTRTLRRDVRGDLDWIVRHALEKDRKRRYQTPLQLADDLRRYLDHEPVHARPPSRSYRFAKLIRKHRVAALACGLFIIALIAGIVSTTTAMVRANESAHRETVARTELERSQQRYRLLASVAMLAQAREEARTIRPAWPSQSAKFAQWMQDLGEPLQRRKPEIERALVDMRMLHGIAIDDETSSLGDADGSARALGGNDARDIDRAERFLYDQLRATRDELETFFGKQGAFEFVSERKQWAETIQARSIEEHSAKWDETVRAVRVDPKYNLVLEPQIGLVPLGRDPESGLFEFAHLRSGRAPVRDAGSGRLTIDEDTGLVFVLVPPGTFKMGQQPEDPAGVRYHKHAAAWEAPVHTVGLPTAFFLSKYEMTQGQWARLARGSRPSLHNKDADVSRFLADGVTLNEAERARAGLVFSDAHPVERISWNDCAELFVLDALMLPTEAQWEYACRAGGEFLWSTGDDVATLEGYANFADSAAASIRDTKPNSAWIPHGDGFAAHAPVDALKPNAWGFHNMHGNVWEWCRDGFLSYRHPVEGEDSLRGDTALPETRRVQRGGSYAVGPEMGRSSMRWSLGPGVRHANCGVRPARALTRS
ncbi:MAG: SUMF1/EgtB/PvdO family nonheme iron enzyme [Planctomycetes bacterium]|nr:SUMF1/EgtB/PvdO family nonheme iron enzyme [Planctomycetota bacterium]MCB9917093.1 SUMF1/EgtB/PvdO family nonheme iron enzyme [Planctomycetota bacterium]